MEDAMTHKEIAKIANVSVSTVSKALSGSRDISEEIAKHVIQIAIDIGYFKEKNKKSFENKRNQSVLVAIVCPEIISIHYSKIVTDIKKAVEAKGGQVAVYIYDFDLQKKEEIVKMLILRGFCDGIVLFNRYNFEASSNIPILCFEGNETEVNKNYDIVYTDCSKILHTAVSCLVNSGHRKIGFIGEPKTIVKQNHFKDALENLGIRANDNYLYIIDKRFEEIGYDAAELFMNSKDRPTAFVAAYDEIALAFIQKLSRNGYTIPDDVSVVGINDIPFSSYAHTPLTTVKTLYEEGLYEAINLLFDEILNNLPSGHKIANKHTLINRETVKEIKND